MRGLEGKSPEKARVMVLAGPLELVVLALYLASSACFLLTIRKRRELLGRAALILAAAGAVAHCAEIVVRGVAGRYVPLTNLFEGFCFLSWCIVISFLIVYAKYRNGEIGSLAMPLAALTLGFAMLLPGAAREPVMEWRGVWIWLHAGTALVSYGGFALAFVAGIMYLVQERQLKSKHSGTVFRWLPSLETLERIDSRAIEVAFPLLTLAMVFGLLWARSDLSTGWSWGSKETFTLVTWLCYAALLHVKRRYSLRGRKIAYLCILGFLLVLFTFVGGSLMSRGPHYFGRELEAETGRQEKVPGVRGGSR